MNGILSVITFLPLVGAAAVLLAGGLAGRRTDAATVGFNVKLIALVTTLAVFALSVVMVARFDTSQAGFQFEEAQTWFAGASYRMGVDGISVLLVLLTTFLMPLCILASWNTIKDRVVEYFVAFLVLETLMVGTFCALDLILFYIFFEFGLIPMFIIIGVWGGKNRIYAAYKFFLYTLLGSVLMLAAILAMVGLAGTSSIPQLLAHHWDPNLQLFLWLAFFASFAVKMPMWPVHTWLPDAHVEAPTAGSVILAGVLLKLGGYGFMRFSVPMFPYASHAFQPLVFALSVTAIVWASLVAFRQTDIKKLIAYSSVAHMGFVTMGIFSGNLQGEQGALYQMLSHGVISGALFLCVGVVYDRMHTREIAFYGGLVNRMPVYAAVFLLFTMGNVGLPGTSGFIGEMLTMVGAYGASTMTALIACTGVILSAVYALSLYRRVTLGEMVNPALAAITDMDAREWVIFAPLVVGTLVLGVYPHLITDVTAASVGRLVDAWRSGAGAGTH